MKSSSDCFKVGDVVEVHNPDPNYERHKGKIGKIIKKGFYYFVDFDGEDDQDSFAARELRFAKNYIVREIIKDL